MSNQMTKNIRFTVGYFLIVSTFTIWLVLLILDYLTTAAAFSINLWKMALIGTVFAVTPFYGIGFWFGFRGDWVKNRFVPWVYVALCGASFGLVLAIYATNLMSA